MAQMLQLSKLQILRRLQALSKAVKHFACLREPAAGPQEVSVHVAGLKCILLNAAARRDVSMQVPPAHSWPNPNPCKPARHVFIEAT